MLGSPGNHVGSTTSSRAGFSAHIQEGPVDSSGVVHIPDLLLSHQDQGDSPPPLSGLPDREGAELEGVPQEEIPLGGTASAS